MAKWCRDQGYCSVWSDSKPTGYGGYEGGTGILFQENVPATQLVETSGSDSNVEGMNEYGDEVTPLVMYMDGFRFLLIVVYLNVGEGLVVAMHPRYVLLWR